MLRVAWDPSLNRGNRFISSEIDGRKEACCYLPLQVLRFIDSVRSILLVSKLLMQRMAGST